MPFSCVVSTNHKSQLYSVDQSQEPVAHPYIMANAEGEIMRGDHTRSIAQVCGTISDLTICDTSHTDTAITLFAHTNSVSV